MGKLSDWEKVRTDPLGAGGQSTVFLVRRPERRRSREKSLEVIKEFSALSLNKPETAIAFARANQDMAREENSDELGALKMFRPRGEGLEAEKQALGRMHNEIAVLKENRPGLLTLLDDNESENWIVTEYCSRGTLEQHLSTFKGNAELTLMSFLSLVRTVANLHKDSIVHRDIKPQNVFLGDSGELILGDFGIVFLPNQAERMSFTGESVGPRDYMPPWIFLDDWPTPITLHLTFTCWEKSYGAW